MMGAKFRPIIILCVAILSLHLIFPQNNSAQEIDPSEPLEDRIAAMNLQIEAGERTLSEIDSRAKEIEGKLKNLKSDSEKLRVEERELTEQLKSLSSERSEIEREINSIDRQGRDLRTVSRQRLTVLYTHPREELFAFLVNQAGSEQMAQSSYYLSVVRSYDLRLLERLHELKLMRDEKRLELTTLEASKEKIASDLKSRRAELQSKIAAQEPLAKSLKAEKAASQSALAELRAKLLRFETVLASLTGGQDDIPDENTRRERRQSKKMEAKEEATIPGYDGTGLKGKRSNLVSPISAKILVGFGKSIGGQESEVRTLSKGIEFQGNSNTQVVAIADGEAIFVGKLPGIGQVAILDHGERYYSLYGRLASVTVDRGEEVKQGSQIGLSGEPDTLGRSFYFEIRKEGVAVNPQDYFAKKLG